METILIEIKNNWQIISGFLTIVCIPMIKKLYEDYHGYKDKYYANLKELENLYESYCTDEKIRNKPKFFHDEQIRKFKEFNNLDFQLFVLLIRDKNMGYRDIVYINRNLQPTFTYLKIVDSKYITYKDDKAKQSILEPKITKTKYIVGFILFIFVMGGFMWIIDNGFFSFIVIMAIIVYEIFILIVLDKLNMNIMLKQRLQSNSAWQDIWKNE